MTVAPLHILAIDDEQLLLWALKRAFDGRQRQFSTATTAEQVKAAIEHRHFDLILLAFELNISAHRSLLQEIDSCCPYVPLLLMTTSDPHSRELNDAIRACRTHGPWQLLEKPFSLDHLLRTVHSLSAAAHAEENRMTNWPLSFDKEKRHHLRHPQVQTIELRLKQILDGESCEVPILGTLTDRSECGVGLLANAPLQRNQVVTFGNQLEAHYGMVAWSRMIEQHTYRAGIHLYGTPIPFGDSSSNRNK